MASGPLGPLATRAQFAAAGGAPVLPQVCVDFAASCSIDPQAGKLVFHWQLGDSTTLTDLVISHCYRHWAHYWVVLDAPRTPEAVRNLKG